MWWIQLLLWVPFITGGFIHAPTVNEIERKEDPKPYALKWVVDKSSTLRVMGRSNVNQFSCLVGSYNQKDTLTLISAGNGGSVKFNGSLQIEIQQFNCNSKLITSDLRKTLKAKEHPVLKVRFLSLEQTPDFKKSSQIIKGWVEVELAGVKKVMQIPFEFNDTNNTITLMDGEKIFCFTDFNLSPPTKMAGTIKIKDEFLVDFRLRLKAII